VCNCCNNPTKLMLSLPATSDCFHDRGPLGSNSQSTTRSVWYRLASVLTAAKVGRRRPEWERSFKLKFHGSSFLVAFSWHPLENVANMSRGNRACRRGCHEDDTRKLLPWNSSFSLQADAIVSFFCSTGRPICRLNYSTTTDFPDMHISVRGQFFTNPRWLTSAI